MTKNGEKDAPLVLVIDDDPLMRRMHEVLLCDLGARVRQAVDTIEGEKLIRELKPALVLLDDIMPNCATGLTLLEKIKKDEACAAIPIIMVTASNKPEERARGFQAGASAYVTKPVDKDALRHAVLEVLRRRRKMVVIVMEQAELAQALSERLTQLTCAVHVGANERAVAPALTQENVPDLVIVSRTAWKNGAWWHEKTQTRRELGGVPILIVGGNEEELRHGIVGASSVMRATGQAGDILLHAARLMRPKDTP